MKFFLKPSNAFIFCFSVALVALGYFYLEQVWFNANCAVIKSEPVGMITVTSHFRYSSLRGRERSAIVRWNYDGEEYVENFKDIGYEYEADSENRFTVYVDPDDPENAHIRRDYN